MNGKLPRQIISQLERESKWVLDEKERERRGDQTRAPPKRGVAEAAG